MPPADARPDRRTAYAAMLVVALLVVAAAGFATRSRPSAPTPSGGKGKVTVAASFYPLYYFAARVGSDMAEVADVTPAGAEPHDYEPTAQDIAGIERSDMLVLMGSSFELWGDNVRRNIDPARTTVVAAGEGLATATLQEGGATVADPHAWLSPPLAKEMVDRIEAAYEKVDPADADVFRANADSLKRDLDEIDNDYRWGLAFCAKKDFVTSHAAFGYLASNYGLRQVAIAGLSPDAEPSPKALAEIASFVRNSGIKYVFFESLVSPKLSDTIAGEVGAKTLVLDPIEGLTKEDFDAGEDYLSKMQSNLKNLQTALECRN